MHNILITIKKEVRSILRDKKTLLTLLVFPFIIPVFIFLEGYMTDNYVEEDYYIGINYDLNSTERTLLDNVNLGTYNYKTKEEMDEAYKDGDILGYIDYNVDTKTYTIYTNQNSSDGGYVTSYIDLYLKGYKDYLKELYLVSEDVDMEYINNIFSVENVNLDGENYILELLFVMSFTYVIMAILASSTNMAISATAVEKENGTLETLLTFPVSIKELVLGKYIASTLIGIISACVGLVITVFSLIIATNVFESFKEIGFSLSVGNIVLSLLVIILASLFIAGVSLLITSKTKSFKEAQSAASILNLIAIVPMFVSLLDLTIDYVYYVIPIFNYIQILIDLFSGSIVVLNILLVLISSVIYGFIVIYLVIRRYRVEEVLF